MPNWCSMDIAFMADPENINELHRLHEVIKRAIKSESVIRNAFGNGWLGNVAAVHGIDFTEEFCRGEIDSIDEIDVESTSFRIYTVTAWLPMPELWDEICEKYPSVSYVYCAEEPCNGIFVNTDRTGEFFPDRIVYDVHCRDLSKPLPPGFFFEGTKPSDVFEEKKYFSDFEELQDYAKKTTGKEFSDVRQIESYFATALAAYCQGYGGICIREFEFE